MSPTLSTYSSAVAAAALLLSAGCKDEPRRGATPQGTPPPSLAPNPPSSAPGAAGAVPKEVCRADVVGVADSTVAMLLPTVVPGAGFCVLKTEQVRSWGEGTTKKIEDVTDVIDGAGDIYVRNYFAKRYDTLRYVDGSGSGAEVEVVVTTYARPENAYALFTYRAVANVDPDPDAAKKAGRRPLRELLGAGQLGAAALGNASALLWKGNYLYELTYSADPSKSAAEATALADRILPKFVEAIAPKVIGTTEPPADVRALPTIAEGRIPLGIDYVPAKFTRPEGKSEALKIAVAGGYATAFLREGDKRARVLAFVRDEKDSAHEAFEAFRKLAGSLPIKDKELGDEAVHFAFPIGGGGAGAAGKGEGVAARRGNVVLAVADEELALGDPGAKDDKSYPRLSKDEKIAKLKALFATRANRGGGPAPSASASAVRPRD